MNNGIAYAIFASCSDPVISNTNLTGTKVWYSDPVAWSGSYSALVHVIYPAGSHGVQEWITSDITQVCPIKIMASSSRMQFSFTVDEWLMVTGGHIVSLTAGGLTATQRMTADTQLYFDEFETMIPLTDRVAWGNMTNWISNAFEKVFDGSVYQSTQGATFCNLLSWGTYPDGFYYPNITYRAVSSAIAATAHFVAMQYDGSASADCEYFGIQNSGQITSPTLQANVSTAFGIISIVLNLWYVLWWYFSNRTDWTADKVKSKAFICVLCLISNSSVFTNPLIASHSSCPSINLGG